ncbi:hypothetical protein KS4_26630 [Poriferisphaera corsica]|uniref:Uncharacterized protein n=1 Tax=Poriferisphaera corsica TaxID=2528020 RepID=A0A517YWK5_9BACT|nr:hypothetical protein [Poriferisphaera corsica]QDU34592.1 hypothetical protein KS4_26630 [Poriferisphaera corsica]
MLTRYFKSLDHLNNMMTFFIILFYLNLFLLRNDTLFLINLITILFIMPFHAFRIYQRAQSKIDRHYAIRHIILYFFLIIPIPFLGQILIPLLLKSDIKKIAAHNNSSD